ncbi:MAG: Ldh family oxidoreductase [Gemmataceae bacterium]
MPLFNAAALETFAADVFQSFGVAAADARLVGHSLVDANLCGHDSHGVIRLVQYADALRDGRLKANAEFSVAKQTAGVLVADGGWGLGQVMAHRLLERLVPRAQALGLAAGTLRHCGHIGRLGEYAEAATAQGLAFMASVNNHGFARGVAPPGGTLARLGTNPLCLGAPTDGDPAVLDIGTSVVAEGKVRVLFNKKQQVPPGWLLDDKGQPTTDPGVLYRDPRGTILPLGGAQAYKGFGIALLLDMFVGGLSGGSCSNPAAPNMSANAVFFLVLDIDQFAGRQYFLDQVTELAKNVRDCPRAEGVQEILLPGDPERREKAKRVKNGIALDDGTWTQLTELAQKQKVAIPPTK